MYSFVQCQFFPDIEKDIPVTKCSVCVSSSSKCKGPIFFKTAMDWNVSPTNSYVETLTPSVMVFEDGAFAKCSGHLTRWGHDGVGALIRRDARELVLSLSLPRKNTVRRQVHTTQEKGLLSEPDHAGTLILDTQPLQLRNQLLLLKPRSVWCFVMAAPAEDKNLKQQ